MYERMEKIEHNWDLTEANSLNLKQAYDNMTNKVCPVRDVAEENDDKLFDSLPFDTIEQLLSEKTSTVQKKTAMKVL